MKNPFPGMNPFLEKRWSDFHTRFNVAISDALNQRLPGDLEARVEESVSVDYDIERRTIYPDVFVIEEQGDDGWSLTATVVATRIAGHDVQVMEVLQ